MYHLYSEHVLTEKELKFLLPVRVSRTQQALVDPDQPPWLPFLASAAPLESDNPGNHGNTHIHVVMVKGGVRVGQYKGLAVIASRKVVGISILYIQFNS